MLISRRPYHYRRPKKRHHSEQDNANDDHEQNNRGGYFSSLEDICHCLETNDPNFTKLRIGWADCDYLIGKKQIRNLHYALKRNYTVTTISIGWRHRDRKILIEFLQILSQLNNHRYLKYTRYKEQSHTLKRIELNFYDWVPANVLINLFSAHPHLEHVYVRATSILPCPPANPRANSSSKSGGSSRDEHKSCSMEDYIRPTNVLPYHYPHNGNCAIVSSLQSRNKDTWYYKKYTSLKSGKHQNPTIDKKRLRSFVYILQDCLGEHKHLKSLSLVDCDIVDDEKAFLITTFVKQRGGIEQLSLCHNRRLTCSCFNIICQAPVYGTLDFSFCNISDKGAMAIADTFRRRRHRITSMNNGKNVKGSKNNNNGKRKMIYGRETDEKDSCNDHKRKKVCGYNNNSNIAVESESSLMKLSSKQTTKDSSWEFLSVSSEQLVVAPSLVPTRGEDDGGVNIVSSGGDSNNDFGGDDDVGGGHDSNGDIPPVVLGELILSGNYEIGSRGFIALSQHCTDCVQHLNLSHCDVDDRQLQEMLREFIQKKQQEDNHNTNGTAPSCLQYITVKDSHVKFSAETRCLLLDLIQQNSTLKSICITNSKRKTEPLPLSYYQQLLDTIKDNYVLEHLEISNYPNYNNNAQDHNSRAHNSNNSGSNAGVSRSRNNHGQPGNDETRSTNDEEQNNTYDNDQNDETITNSTNSNAPRNEHTVREELDFYLRLNRAGRRILRFHPCSPDTSTSRKDYSMGSDHGKNHVSKNSHTEQDWIGVLSEASGQVDALYWLLRNRPCQPLA